MNSSHLRTPSNKPRARALGIPLSGEPGPYNAITDVPGVSVGYTTVIRGDGPLVVGQGPVRTGVTAILPRGREGVSTPVFAGCHSLNGNGEMTGFVWIEEAGRLEGPITITNTHSCGVVRDAVIRWAVKKGLFTEGWGLPVAAETYDGHLNDINGFHISEEHVYAALDGASGGALEEGSVGGGTGMICYEFKGGSGTASRTLEIAGSRYTVAAFVQANFGRRQQLTVAGVPVGQHLGASDNERGDDGSVIGVIATDIPLIPHQLKRLARRGGLGIGRSGSVAAHGSGDLFLAFSIANGAALDGDGIRKLEVLSDEDLTPAFEAVVQSVDEAVINALVANDTMVGRDDHRVPALPHDQLREVLEYYGRLHTTGQVP